MVAVYHFSADDVGTCRKDGISAVVGYVASKQQWDYFNGCWQRELDKAGIPFLHTSKHLSTFPLIGGSPTDDDVYNILKPFIEVVQNVIFRPPANVSRPGFGVCVITPCGAYDQLTLDEKRYIREPELNSFEMAVGLSCFNLKNDLSDANPIAVQMDESEEIARFCSRYLALKRENETLRKYLGAICFADDEKHRPIQAADMLGNLTLRAWRNHLAGKDDPLAFRCLVFPDEGQASPLARLICDAEKLRTWAKMRKECEDRMAMPEL